VIKRLQESSGCLVAPLLPRLDVRRSPLLFRLLQTAQYRGNGTDGIAMQRLDDFEAHFAAPDLSNHPLIDRLTLTAEAKCQSETCLLGRVHSCDPEFDGLKELDRITSRRYVELIFVSLLDFVEGELKRFFLCGTNRGPLLAQVVCDTPMWLSTSLHSSPLLGRRV